MILTNLYTLTVNKTLQVTGGTGSNLGLSNAGTIIYGSGSGSSRLGNAGSNSGTIKFGGTAPGLTIASTLNNAGGIINTTGGTLSLAGASITGGSLTGSGTVTATGTNTLNGITNSATVGVSSGTTSLAGTINNTGGTFARSGGTLRLSGATISNGSVTGDFTTTNSTNTLNGVAYSGGTFTVSTGTTTLAGTIANSGSISMTGGTLSADVGGATLSGGTLDTGNSGHFTGGTLTLDGVTATINGGHNSANILSSGSSTLDIAGTIANAGGTFSQSGLATATLDGATLNGGTLSGAFGTTDTITELNGVTLASGTAINTSAGGELVLQGAITNGGTVNGYFLDTTTVTGGILTGTGASSAGNNTLRNLTNSGGQIFFAGGTNTVDGVTNTGGIQSDGDGSLVVFRNSIVNTGGHIDTDGVGALQLGGATITGGTLDWSVGVAAGSTNVLNGVAYGTLSIGTMTLDGGSKNTINGGTFGDFGNITVSGAGTTLTLQGAIAGGAQIQQSGPALLTLDSASVTGTITGDLGVTAGSTNAFAGGYSGGTLTLDGNSTLTFGSAEILGNNSGAINVGAGSALVLVGELDNSAGSIAGVSGASILLNGANVSGGTLTGSAGVQAGSSNELSGIVLSGGTLTLDGGSHNVLDYVSNAGTIAVGASTTVSGVLDNTGGSIQIGDGKVLTLEGEIDNGTIVTAGTGKVLVSASSTLSGTGAGSYNLQVGSGCGCSAWLDIAGEDFNLQAGVLTTVIDGGTLNAENNINTAGTLLVENGGSLYGVDVTQTAGGTTIDGYASYNSYALDGGVLDGSGDLDGSAGLAIGADGTLAGNLTVNDSVDNAGIVDPGDGDSVGLLSVESYTQESGGDLTIDLFGADEWDEIDVSSLALLGGTIDFASEGGWTPQAGDRYRFLTAEAISGEFETVDYSFALNPTLAYSLVYGDGYVELDVDASAAPEPGAWLLAMSGAGVLVWRKRGVRGLG